MILSVSRRTDIPDYYFDWFLNRLQEGFLYVRNPMNPHQISRISLSPDVVDCMVFWTKNPAAMLGQLHRLEPYPYYVQFTLTGYGKDIEPGLPPKRTELISTFQRLSRIIGNGRVVWRYDPVFFSPVYTPEYHLKAFEEIARSLAGYTRRVVVSFLDLYAKTKRNTSGLQILDPSEQEMLAFAAKLHAIAARYSLTIESCAEAIDLSEAGIQHGCCIDRRLIEEVIGCSIQADKDKNQRAECGCIESVEVGTYNTCKNGCRYCYANYSETMVKQQAAAYDPLAPLLCGQVGPEDKVTERKMKSLKIEQLSLFDEPFPLPEVPR